MATSAATLLSRPRVQALARPGLIAPLGLGVLAALSVILRTSDFDAGFWVDEGLSFGIADRPIGDIPGVMRQDGSPPLYYMLLHVWMRVLGVRSEAALHAFSLLAAIAAIPVAWAFARALFGTRAGWMAAVLVACNPFLTQYAQENRMYALVVLLTITTTACFIGAFALEKGRRWIVAFALAQTVLLYTHNWGLFLGAGLAAGWLGLVVTQPERRRQITRDGLLAAGIIFVLYLPWLPTLAFQAAHTGAPWANPPGLASFYEAPSKLLGLTAQYLLLLGGGAGLVTLTRGPHRRAAVILACAAAVTIAIPWLLSQAAPAWATRYLAVALGPLVLLAALGLSRAGTVGLAAVVLAMLVSVGVTPPHTKSNVHLLTETVEPSLRDGDVIISTQPEQIPVLHYYLHSLDLRYASLTGPVTDLGVTDWRDGIDRLEATTVAGDLDPVLNALKPGQRVALMTPDVSILSRWKAPWSELVRVRSAAWEQRMRSDPRFRVITVEPPNPVRRPNEVRATVFIRQTVESRSSTRLAGAENPPLTSNLP